MMHKLSTNSKAIYMRNYMAKNKDKINEQCRQRRANASSERLEELREQSRIRNRKYHLNNKDEVNARAANNKWYYTPEKGKAKRGKYGMKYGPRVAITSARNRAKKMNLPFDLTIEWYEKEFEKGCAITGLKLDPNGSKTPWTVHVDRIIPALGYVMSNCRLVCACYNLAKKNWTDEDILLMAKSLVIKSNNKD